jgi:hypothetical protein
MSLQEDLVTVYGFLQHTNQGNLKKMLVDGRFTETHLNLLLKIAKNSTEDQFIQLAEKGEFPKVKLSNNEAAIKEAFWKVCFETLQSRGLISAGEAKAA